MKISRNGLQRRSGGTVASLSDDGRSFDLGNRQILHNLLDPWAMNNRETSVTGRLRVLVRDALADARLSAQIDALVAKLRDA